MRVLRFIMLLGIIFREFLIIDVNDVTVNGMVKTTMKESKT